MSYMEEMEAALWFLHYGIHEEGNVKNIPSLMFWGPPGAGKTFSAEDYAERNGWKLLFYQCDNKTTAEELIYGFNGAIMSDAISPRGNMTGDQSLVKGILWQAIENSWDPEIEMVLVILDEYDKTTQDADSILLDFLNSTRLSNPIFQQYTGGSNTIQGNRKKVRVIFTSNEHRQLTEPMFRRIKRVKVDFPDKETMLNTIIPSMLGRELIETIGLKNIKLMVNFMYDWRAGNPTRTLVQNQLCDIIVAMHKIYTERSRNEALAFGQKVLTMLVTDDETDRLRWGQENVKIKNKEGQEMGLKRGLCPNMGPKYLMSKFISDYGKSE